MPFAIALVSYFAAPSLISRFTGFSAFQPNAFAASVTDMPGESTIKYSWPLMFRHNISLLGFVVCHLPPLRRHAAIFLFQNFMHGKCIYIRLLLAFLNNCMAFAG